MCLYGSNYPLPHGQCIHHIHLNIVQLRILFKKHLIIIYFFKMSISSLHNNFKIHKSGGKNQSLSLLWGFSKKHGLSQWEGREWFGSEKNHITHQKLSMTLWEMNHSSGLAVFTLLSADFDTWNLLFAWAGKYVWVWRRKGALVPHLALGASQDVGLDHCTRAT